MAVRTFTRPSSLSKKLAISTKDKMSHSSAAPGRTEDQKPSPATDAGNTTFAFQDRLPKLPIPDLEDTCTRYMGSLRPLQTSKEHAESTAAVKDFLRVEGPDLQEKLKKYASGRSNYIEQFCMSPIPNPPFLLF